MFTLKALTDPRPKKRNYAIVLQWLPAHVGVHYNGRADGLAKQGGRDKSSEIITVKLTDEEKSSIAMKFEWQ